MRFHTVVKILSPQRHHCLLFPFVWTWPCNWRCSTCAKRCLLVVRRTYRATATRLGRNCLFNQQAFNNSTKAGTVGELLISKTRSLCPGRVQLSDKKDKEITNNRDKPRPSYWNHWWSVLGYCQQQKKTMSSRQSKSRHTSLACRHLLACGWGLITTPRQSEQARWGEKESQGQTWGQK